MMSDEDKTKTPSMETRQLENVAIAEGSLPVDAATEALFKAETAKMDTDKMWIIMGPQHPFSHGLWTLKIQVDGEMVTDADPIVGYLHRGWEKEVENRTYPKIIPMADRLCYAASMTYTHLFCMACEKALDMEIPEKAKLDGEYCKKLSLGMDVKCFLGSVGVFGGDDSVVEGGTGEMAKKGMKR